MDHSILIADDSLTIQKVIRITLSSESYDLSDCDNSRKLFELVETSKPSLVLLDFTLDEGISGYDICKKIQKISPETRVMIMYGTFDSIDDELFHSSGAAGKITKPFDGQKFITMCHQILEDQEFYGVTSQESPLEAINSELSEVQKEPVISLVSDIEPIEEIEAEVADEWSLDDENIELAQETLEVLEQPDTFTENIDDNFNFQSMVSDELNDWGMSVPSLLEEKSVVLDEPEVIVDEVKEKVSDIAAIADLTHVDEVSIAEDSTDLNFSNLVEEQPVKLEIVADNVEQEHEVSVNSQGELEAKELIDFDLNNNEDKFSALESQLGDDIDDLWKVDEIATKAEEQVQEELEASEVLEDVDVSAIDKSEIKLLVQDYMSKHGKAIIERVAWEMIPDMAENIIREEVKTMAEKVLSKD